MAKRSNVAVSAGSNFSHCQAGLASMLSTLELRMAHDSERALAAAYHLQPADPPPEDYTGVAPGNHVFARPGASRR
jgi:hypothetical protein